MTRHTTLLTLLATLSLVGLGACGETDDHNHEENHANNHKENHDHGGPEEEACEHMKDGPEIAVSAVAALTETLPDATAEHTRVDVTLTDFDGQKGGYVRYESDHTGDVYFFVDQSVTFAILDDQDQPVALEGSGDAVDACAEVAESHTAELTAGSSYRLVFGPTMAETVSFVAEHGEGGEHSDHANHDHANHDHHSE